MPLQFAQILLAIRDILAKDTLQRLVGAADEEIEEEQEKEEKVKWEAKEEEEKTKRWQWARGGDEEQEA